MTKGPCCLFYNFQPNGCLKTCIWEPLCTVAGTVIGTATMENSMEVPQKIKNRTTIQSSNSTSGYLSEENKNTNSKRYMHPYAHCSTNYNNQDMETT